MIFDGARGDLENFQKELRVFVAEEFRLQREAVEKLWALPVERKVEEGRCIAGAVFTGLAGMPARLVFEVKGNDSRFREGDFVRLSFGDPREAICEGVFEVCDDFRLELIPHGVSAHRVKLPVGAGGLQLDEAFLDLEFLYQDAIAELARTALGRDVILPILEGGVKPEIEIEEFDAAFGREKKNGMHDRQAEAVASALATDSYWLVHGPPGTGKTKVLSRIVAESIGKGERVLVTAANHTAINNLLEAVLREVGDGERVVKIAPFRDHSLRVKQFEYFKDAGLGFLDGGFAVGATPFSLRSKRLRGEDFDLVVVDEASQMTVPLAVMAMLGGRRYIFAGDHRQLPPVCVSVSQEDAARVSVFAGLQAFGADTMLTVTHRLNDALCRWPSERFYRSKLEPHPSVAGRRLRVSEDEKGGVASPEPPVVCFCEEHEGSTTHSEEEIRRVVQIVGSLRRAGVSSEEIGVVVPFRKQARYLRKRLARKGEGRGPLVDTVERMQGQEREVIVISFTVSDWNFAGRVEKFLFQAERLNVAVTRAKTKLYLVVSKSLLEYAEKCLDGEAKEVFLSLFESVERVAGGEGEGG